MLYSQSYQQGSDNLVLPEGAAQVQGQGCPEELPHFQAKEQRLRFAGAAVKR